MRRAALALVFLGLAGCGHEDKKDAAKPAPASEQAKDSADKAIEKLRRSDLPKDALKELEDAKKLLDAQKQP